MGTLTPVILRREDAEGSQNSKLSHSEILHRASPVQDDGGTLRRVGPLRILLLILAGCASAPAGNPAPPWSAAPLTEVPAVYRTEWQMAENRGGCALVAFANHAGLPDVTPRRANFSGGWAVAYDTPSKRSAFGIAGTGTTPTGSYQWPDSLEWSDGSRATWGLEGGTGPNHLAYVTIAGQNCLYNVWSAEGKDHLEQLLRQIRFVTIPQ